MAAPTDSPEPTAYADHIRDQVDQAPPLSAEQAAQLAGLLHDPMTRLLADTTNTGTDAA